MSYISQSEGVLNLIISAMVALLLLRTLIGFSGFLVLLNRCKSFMRNINVSYLLVSVDDIGLCIS